jgi:hypothetical protein
MSDRPLPYFMEWVEYCGRRRRRWEVGVVLRMEGFCVSLVEAAVAAMPTVEERPVDEKARLSAWLRLLGLEADV